MIMIAVNGGAGKMGRRIIELACADKNLKVTAVLERPGHPLLGTAAGGAVVGDDPGQVAKADVIIDFSSPEACLNLAGQAVKYNKAMVIGTTGFSKGQIRNLRDAAGQIPLVFSPNMSVGVNVLFQLVREAAAKLNNYAVSVSETHHAHKKDAPSGTAIKLAEIIQEQTGYRISDIKSYREGEVIGEHTVTFSGGLDTIVISHAAKTRDIFAAGALKAAKWVAGKKAGFYGMHDVLGGHE